MNKIKQGDEVIVLVGKNKSRRGKVIRVLGGDRLIVEGVNLVKRHTRPNPQMNQPGGIVEKEASIHISNVALYNPATQKGDRIGVRTLADGTRKRYFKSNGEVVDL